ncbi:hypothetical protein HNP46_000010 [Pseudomonas nitritireducens]|uniref:Uncharacterized protein n=1 Tax=Pseudomonas nitroreducens TaxID=46680 RepID=A0A7W7NZ33_PSENT|nr:hypothetical protein [Pseudomonas nitritireducens]MBB4861199.1 hypothetical protein [Pseudomonas nitritireducens]
MLIVLLTALVVQLNKGPASPIQVDEEAAEDSPTPTPSRPSLYLSDSAGSTEQAEADSEPLQEAGISDQDEEGAPGWQYDSDANGAELATLLSNNSIQVGGDSGPMQQAVLQLREHPGHGKDAIFYVPGASASCSTRCSLHVRFSAGKVKDFTAYAGEEDGQSLLIIRDYGVFLPMLKRSAVVQIDAELQGHKPETMSFSVEGLSWR